jgi:hypothetical protein
MRTKALLCAAALAAGAATSMAQNVYSLNVVGYINLNLNTGLNLIANQLDADGTMMNNFVTNVFSTNLPSGSKVYAFNATSGAYSTLTFTSGKWIGTQTAANAALAPGQGVFVSVPSPVTLTLVGEVIQGTNKTALVQGLQIVSSIPPISGGLQTTLGYVPTAGDKVFTYNSTNQAYATHTYSSSAGTFKWIGGEPTPNVGDAFFLQAAAATNWTQAFTVQ